MGVGDEEMPTTKLPPKPGLKTKPPAKPPVKAAKDDSSDSESDSSDEAPGWYTIWTLNVEFVTMLCTKLNFTTSR